MVVAGGVAGAGRVVTGGAVTSGGVTNRMTTVMGSDRGSSGGAVTGDERVGPGCSRGCRFRPGRGLGWALGWWLGRALG